MADFYTRVKAELDTLNIDTAPEVKNFRVPGERRDNQGSVTSGDMFTVLNAIAATLGKQWVSRRRVRSLALRALNEGAL